MSDFARALKSLESGDVDGDAARAPVWMTDASSDACQRCQAAFTVVKRRHHCRRCGILACSSCCSNFRYLANLEKQKRVCDQCCIDMDATKHSDRPSEFRLRARILPPGSPKALYFKLALKMDGKTIALRGPSNAQSASDASFVVPVPLPLTSEYELDLEVFDSQSNQRTGACSIDIQEILLMHKVMRGGQWERAYQIIPAVRKLGSGPALKTKFSPSPSPVHRALKSVPSFTSFMDSRKGRHSSAAASQVSIEWSLKCPPRAVLSRRGRKCVGRNCAVESPRARV